MGWLRFRLEYPAHASRSYIRSVRHAWGKILDISKSGSAWDADANRQRHEADNVNTFVICRSGSCQFNLLDKQFPYARVEVLLALYLSLTVLSKFDTMNRVLDITPLQVWTQYFQLHKNEAPMLSFLVLCDHRVWPFQKRYQINAFHNPEKSLCPETPCF